MKNPAYRDVMYAEELIGPNTIDTMPPKLIDAFRDQAADPDLSLNWFDAMVLTKKAREQQDMPTEAVAAPKSRI